MHKPRLRPKIAGMKQVFLCAALAVGVAMGGISGAVLAQEGAPEVAQVEGAAGLWARWNRLRLGEGTFADYRDFLTAYPQVPDRKTLLRRAEDAWLATADGPDAMWFAETPPSSDAGRARLADHWRAAGDQDTLRTVWRNGGAEAFFDGLTTEDHDAHLRALLDAGEWRKARAFLDQEPPLVSAGAAQLGFARIATQSGGAGVDGLILSLPAQAREDAGLAVDRFRFRLRAKRLDLAEALMIERSTDAAALGQPEAWAAKRRDFARAALRAGDAGRAYDLAARHFLPVDHRDYSDLEWLAGYAALRMGDGARALSHFRHLQTVVATPISLSRALYWQGRAAEVLGDPTAARSAYHAAAMYQAPYYSQLAGEKTGARMADDLAVTGRGDASLPDWRGTDLSRNGMFQVAIWLYDQNRMAEAGVFLLAIGKDSPAEDIGRLARLALERGDTTGALRLGKQAAAKGAIYPAAYFPLPDLAMDRLLIPTELALAIARQESEFDPNAGSPVGAQGLMQVMPETARAVARIWRLPYDKGRLLSDAGYNAQIGGAYLLGLREAFGPSVAMVAAGYNAGPGRPARWAKERGDPRQGPSGTDEAVDWVEMIPFDETRNYVMRVAEALAPYRARLSGRAGPFALGADLRGDGIIPPPPPVLRDSPPPKPAPDGLDERFFDRIATTLAAAVVSGGEWTASGAPW